jgi:alkylation response protein AidB-like acyl-CoA dehydrogenase
VDFDLSEDQQALRGAADALLDDLAGTARVREVAAGDDPVDRALWAAMADQGWLAVEHPVADGGLGLGLVEMAVLCECVGAHVAPVPFLGTVLVLGALAGALAAGEVDGDDSLGGSVTLEGAIARLAGGEAVGALAWSRRADAVLARPGADGRWLLSGRADPVVDGPAADVLVVFADSDEGPGLFAVSPAPGFPAPAEPAMDRTRGVSWLTLEAAPALRIGSGDAAETLLDRAATLACAEMLGAARRVLDMSVEYAKDRVQFDRPIGSFQAVKHRCADMLVDVEGMRSSAYYAAWAVGAGDPDARAAASAAKVWCSDASARVMAGGLQVHGGIGFTWEHDLHLFVKRAQLDQVRFGDATVHRERLAAILRPRAEKGEPVL